MSTDYKIILVCSDSSLWHDLDNVQKLNQRLLAPGKSDYEGNGLCDYADPFMCLNLVKAIQSFGESIWMTEYVKNMHVGAFLMAVKEYQWSDWLQVSISTNGDPFELCIGRVHEAHEG